MVTSEVNIFFGVCAQIFMRLDPITKHKCSPEYELHLDSPFGGTVEYSEIEILTHEVKHKEMCNGSSFSTLIFCIPMA